MKISVITSTFNRINYLPQTIESVSASVLGPLADIEIEHIIYDDASTDGTEEIFKSKTPSNIRYIRGTENKGQSYGRNIAIAQSTGEYIFLIDSDDILLQRSLYNFTRVALDYPMAGWFISGFLHTDENLAYLIGRDYYPWKFKDTKSYLGAIFKGEHFIQSNVFFKKSLFNEVSGFDVDLKMSEDLDLFVRFLLIGQLPSYCDFHSHLHRIHEHNMSKGITNHDHTRDIARLQEKYKNELQKQGIIGII